MPFYDTTPSAFDVKIREGSVQQDLGKLLGKQWGTTGDATVAKILKACFPDNYLSPTWAPTSTSDLDFQLGRHFVYKNTDGRLLGLAMLGKFSYPYADVMSESGSADKAGLQAWFRSDEFVAWAISKGKETISNTIWHWYMAEEEPDLSSDNVSQQTIDGVTYDALWFPWDGDLIRAALDIEVIKTDAIVPPGSASAEIRIFNQKPSVMQSPISKSIVRTKLLEDLYDEAHSNPWQNTNWWPDSEIRMVGQIDKDSCFLMIQCDNVPAWEGAVVPQIPLYFSKINPLDSGDSAYAFFTGSVAAKDTSVSAIANFDMDDPDRKNFAELYLPLLKTYPGKPSNGIDTVMVSRSKFGARYQEYFLSWNTAPNLMPPLREENGHDYPRAWNNALADEYRFQFNPSRYSNKVHSSKIYIVHPEEGVRGNLMSCIGLSALNFNSGKLRVRRATCPDKFDVYRYFLAEGVSPLNKRPGTAYRPVGVGIYDEASSDPI